MTARATKRAKRGAATDADTGAADDDARRARERAPALQPALLAWYRAHRRDLPWRRTRDPYAIWLSEVMLQQTRVETVMPYYERFLREFPTMSALAEAPLDRVLTLWAGLGYYRRARMLHRAAQQVHEEHRGQLPGTVEGLRAVHGIGPYTAGAVASIAFDRAAALVDGNVARVLARLFALDDDMRSPRGMARAWRFAEALVPAEAAGEWNQGLMELGATLCVPRTPRCLLCPLATVCEARAQGRESELPLMGKKAEPLAERRVALVAIRGAGTSKNASPDEAVLLAQRRPDVRFGGMWEPPSVIADDEEAVVDLTALAGGELSGTSSAGEVVHVLSHRRLTVDVQRATLGRLAPEESAPLPEEYERRKLVTRDQLAEHALTTLARKILATAGW